MNSKWASHLSDLEQKKEFNNLVGNSTQIISRLDDIIQEEIDTIQRERVKDDTFSNPSWALLQAHKLGQIKALLKIKELTKTKKVK